MTFIQKLNPINKEEEKRKFFFDPQYNPQFKYLEEISEQELHQYGAASDQFLPQAQRNLETILKKYGSEAKYLEEVEGKVISRDEAERSIGEYLRALGLENTLQVTYSSKYIARTSVHEDTLRIRLPIEYRDHSFEGVLNHEIGTHFLKNLNDRLQPWYKNRRAFDLQDHLETEEGLAVMHSYLPLKEKHLWIQSLYYLGVWHAQRLSFSQLFKFLEAFTEDKERRWKFCVRMKRGLKDTSQPGGISRDQVYFRGAFLVYKWLEQHEFDVTSLYMGKIHHDDVLRLKSTISVNDVRLPMFIGKGFESYKKKIEEMYRLNFE